jgi:hypothetical protein
MVRSILLAMTLGLVVAPAARAGAVASGGGSRPSIAASAKDCIQAWPEARYRALGYNHIVHVRDICDQRAECSVSTNVNPEPQQVTVPGHSEVEVTTFLGSPAREFTPKVDCRLVP